jgi:hypothetical protein
MHWSKNRSAPMQFNTLPQSEYYKPQGNMDSFMQQQHPIEMSPNHVRAEMGENQQSIELPAGR